MRRLRFRRDMTLFPTATYRFQFHREFTFAHARALVPYLHRLGISHVYASPISRAAPGSTHGYDVCDHNELNPELGTREDFEALSAELKKHDMGLLVDFVPNHMGIEHAVNPWWRNVLENGPASPYAKFFDIDWRPLKRELNNKVLLPVLGEQYGKTLESDGFKIAYDKGVFSLRHGDHLTLPLAPATTLPLLQSAIKLMTPAPAELESIATAVRNLPPRTETDPERLAERERERGIIRDRLVRLCAEAPAVGEALQKVVTEWNDASDPERFDRMDALISEQPYRLSSWRVAGEEINYRRFFDVNTLAAIRMELPEVFDATHALLFELIDAGHITGVRIDHIDGLAHPSEYLTRLRERGGPGLYLLVEKILGTDEKLRGDWPVQGTTGYEFASQAMQVLVHGDGIAEMAAAYEKFIGFHLDYAEVIYRSKKLVMQTSMASDANVLGNLLNRISESHRWYRDFTLNALTTAVRELIACFPVYRTYVDPARPADESDIRVIRRALWLARRRNPALERTVFEFLQDVLLPPLDNPHPVDEELRQLFVLKFQQCTGPITAKGVEDTAFYVFNRLTALNEVGGSPASSAITVDAFHKQNVVRSVEFPHSMLSTSTHDTKRSEDVRARILVLSEMADEWKANLRRWHTANRRHRRSIEGEFAPDHNEEHLIYQTLLGAWPMEGLTDENRAEFTQRVQDYMMKALHEAKVNSSWLEPNNVWDEAVRDFVGAILAAGKDNRFPTAFEAFAKPVAGFGMVNSLAQTVLKLTCPGMPDCYQGSEMWDFSLVDPDNRRPVDYELRKQRLEGVVRAPSRDLMEHWQDGRIKLLITHRLLELRRKMPEVFGTGAYVPVATSGAFADKLVAFERRGTGAAESVLVIVPRHTVALGFPALGEVWQDTQVSAAAEGAPWRDVFTGREHTGGPLALSAVLSDLPCAVLVRGGSGD